MSTPASAPAYWAALAVTAACLDPVDPAAAQSSPAAQRGLTFVRLQCAQCHAIDAVSENPLTIAPPFRTLHLISR
jgi:mono/diheme cytochrome c family protein